MGDFRQTLERAHDLHRQGRWREAETLYRQVLLHAPLHADALNHLGTLLAETRRGGEAAHLLAMAVERQPHNPDFRVSLGHSARAGGDLDVAEACYRTALQFDQAHEAAALTLGALLEQRGRPAAAERVYRALLQHRPDARAVQRGLAGLLERLGRPEEAETTLAALAAAAPDDIEALTGLAAIRLRRGRHDAAAATYRQALAVDDRAAVLHVGLGQALLGRGAPAAAAAAFRDGLARDPRAAETHAGLIQALLADGRFEQAVAAGERATALPAAPAALHCDLARALARAGRPEAALRALARALARDPHQVPAYAQLAPLLDATGRAREAARLFDFPRLLYWRRQREVPGYASVAAFNRQLAAHMRARAEASGGVPDAATRGGRRIAALLIDPAPVVQALAGLFAEAAEAYLAQHRGATDHPYFAAPPARWRLLGDGLILGPSGYQDPHLHPTSYLSGVYYVEVPREIWRGEGAAGCIRFYDAPRAEQVGRFETLRPKNGLLVLFPSYFWHGTLPFASRAERLSVAVELVPAEASDPGRTTLLG